MIPQYGANLLSYTRALNDLMESMKTNAGPPKTQDMMYLSHDQLLLSILHKCFKRRMKCDHHNSS